MSEQPRYVGLLQRLIATPSVSRAESGTADIIYDYLAAHGAVPERVHNNIFAFSEGFYPARPTLLLNSHHDTVRPAASYTRDPHRPDIEDGCLYGLGSNDAGASAVTLTEVFLNLRSRALPFNLLLAITAEEEVGGEHGMRAFLPAMAGRGIEIACAIVGEPTGMQPAVAERGLVVLDCVTCGVSGHAARGEGINALYRAIDDIDRLRRWHAPEASEILGDVTLNITQIEAGRAHNVIPDECRWVVDIRTTDRYSNEETVEMLRDVVCHTEMTPRSTRVRASVIAGVHPLVQVCRRLGLVPFVSPTTSDMSLMHGFPSLKIGPGESSRSHSADEYVRLDEMERAVEIYTEIITSLTTLQE